MKERERRACGTLLEQCLRVLKKSELSASLSLLLHIDWLFISVGQIEVGSIVLDLQCNLGDPHHAMPHYTFSKPGNLSQKIRLVSRYLHVTRALVLTSLE